MQCVDVLCSEGSGVTYPVRSVRDDSDRLLGRSQHWPEEGESGAWVVVSTWFCCFFLSWLA